MRDGPAGRLPRICHVNLARGFRGGERQTELLIRALQGQVGSQRLVARAGEPLTTRLSGVPDVEVVAVRTRVGAVFAIADADLVHAHETHGAQVAMLRSCRWPAPYVVTRRVDNRPRTDVFTRAIYRRAAAVVVLSRAIGTVMRSYDSDLAFHEIPSASSDLRSDRAWVRAFRERHPERFLVGTIGALDERKGHLVLIEAAGMLAESHPRLHFVLVGSGRDEVTMRRAAAHLPNVTFAGWSANVGDYLAAFDLFVFPSLSEGLGSTLIDAMQFGLPIVASWAGGIPELVADGENGLLVPPGDAHALADAIRALYERPDSRIAMGEANRVRSQGFSAERMADRYLHVYRQLLPDFNWNGKVE